MSHKLRSTIIIGLLFSVFIAQCVFSMRLKSPTSDEFAHHLASGYTHLVKQDFRMNPAMPPLPRILTAIPMVALGAKAPWEHSSWKEGNSPIFARQFFYHANKNYEQLIFWARTPIIFLSLLFALSIFLWCQKLFGSSAGYIAVFLYCFEPNIIAHSRLATSDLSVAFFYYLTIISFWGYLKKPSWQTMFLTGLACGACFLSKFTALLLLPTLLLIVLFSRSFAQIKLGKVALFLVITAMTIWAGYFFELKPLIENVPDIPKKVAFLNELGGPQLVNFAQHTPIPLASFFQALGGMLFTRAAGTKAFLWGEWSGMGWWYYYFVAFAIKNTIPMLLLGMLGLIGLFKSKLELVSKSTLVVPLILFFLVTMPDKAQAGIRYFLPIYPLFIILGAAFAAKLWRRGVLSKCVVMALLLWHAYAALSIFPDYLTYFNESVGGPKKGHLYLRDSNIDWGQDLKSLAEWTASQGYDEIVLLYYGAAQPDEEGIPVRAMTNAEFSHPRKTVYALGVHHIDSVLWHNNHVPTKIIGNTIYIYDFR